MSPMDAGTRCGVRKGGHPALALEVGPELPQEERVAARPVPEQGGGRPCFAQRKPSPDAQVLSDGLGPQAAQIEAADAFQPVQFRDPGGQIIGTVGGGVPEGSHDQHRGFRAALDHVLEQGEGRKLGPMQVVDHQRQGPHLRQGP